MNEKQKTKLFTIMSATSATVLSAAVIFIGVKVICLKPNINYGDWFIRSVNAVVDLCLNKQSQSNTMTVQPSRQNQSQNNNHNVINNDSNQSYSSPFSKQYLEACHIDTQRLSKDGQTWVYLIQSGDTLTKLSRAFQHSVDELANYNQIRDVNLIYANSSLRIPY